MLDYGCENVRFYPFVLNAPKYTMLQRRICEFPDYSISQRLPHANHHQTAKHPSLRWGGGTSGKWGGAGPAWCSGSTSVPFWAPTGLLGSGLALCCCSRSFLSVKGLAVALLGDHQRDVKIRLILCTQLCRHWGWGGRGGWWLEAIIGEAPPLPSPPIDWGPAEVWASVSSVEWKSVQLSSVLERRVMENNIVCPPNNLLHCISFQFHLREQSGFYKSRFLQRALIRGIGIKTPQPECY